MFRSMGYEDKADLLETKGMPYSRYYDLDGYPDYYYGSLALYFFNSGLHHPYPPPDEGMKISAQKKAKTQYPMILFYHSPMKPPFSCEYVVFCDKYILILKES